MKPSFSDIHWPTRYWITPNFKGELTDYLALILQRLEQGIELIQLRSKQLPSDEYHALVTAVLPVVKRYQAKLVLNGSPNLLQTLPNADGIHLASCLHTTFTARPIPKRYCLSVACHNAAELKQATLLSADIVTLSPVFPTPSSPLSQTTALGWEAFSKLAQTTSLPVYALGGVTINDYKVAQKAGAYGIAGIQLGL